MSESTGVKNKSRRNFFKFAPALPLLPKIAFTLGASEAALVAGAEVVGRIGARVEKWPTDPVFEKISQFFSTPIKPNAQDYVDAYKDIVDPLYDLKTLPENIFVVNCDINWHDSTGGYQSVGVFKNSGEPTETSVTTTKFTTAQTPNDVKNIVDKIQNDPNNSLWFAVFEVQYSFIARGPSNISVSRSNIFYLEFHKPGDFTYNGKEVWLRKSSIDQFDGFDGKDYSVGHVIEELFDKEGNLIESIPYFTSDGRIANNSGNEAEIFAKTSDWYDKKAKEAGK